MKTCKGFQIKCVEWLNGAKSALILDASFMKRRFYESFLFKGCFENCLKNCLTNCFGGRFKDTFKVVPKDVSDESFKKVTNENIESAKNHLNKYLNDLKLHFDLTEADIQQILINTYRSNKPQNPFIQCLSMLKYWS